MADAGKQEKNGRRGLLSRAARGASDRVLDIVDPDVVLEHVDVNALLERVDVNTLLDRVDVNALLDRVDVDALLGRADIDALMERVDVKALVDKAGIPEIVADSTAHLTGSALDLFRRPIVGLDEIVFRVLNRILRRDVNSFPDGPAPLVDWVDEHSERDSNVSTGRYAGPVTRLLAVIIDGFVVSVGFTLTLAGLGFVLSLVSDGLDFSGRRGFWLASLFVLWILLYLVIGIAVFGKTIGKAVMGVRVVSSDGSIVIKRPPGRVAGS